MDDIKLIIEVEKLITAEVCDIISNARRFGVATASGVTSQAPARPGISAYATLRRRFRVRGPAEALGLTGENKQYALTEQGECLAEAFLPAENYDPRADVCSSSSQLQSYDPGNALVRATVNMSVQSSSRSNSSREELRNDRSNRSEAAIKRQE
ncbi:unnamed protein product, partial [Pleuronectes platessa]